jgi:hypothetical protein
MKESVELVLKGFFFTVFRMSVNVEGQAGDGFSKDPDAGVDCCGLHGCFFVDCFATGGTAK